MILKPQQRSFEWTDSLKDLVEPVQVNHPVNGRHYVSPDGVIMTSVTTFLGQVGDKAALERWYDEVGHEEAERIKNEASIRGSALHKSMEDYLTDSPGWQERNKKISLFPQLKRVADMCLGKIHGQEFALYSNYMNLAGTADLLAEWKGKLSIIDWKSSRKLKRLEYIEGYFLQTCIYSMMLQERTGIKAEQLVVVIGTDGEQKASVFIQDRAKWMPKVLDLVRKHKKN